MWGLLAPLEDAGVLDPIEGDHRLADGVELHHLPGHTPGHQILRVVAGADRLTISADTWNHPAQLAHPEWPSGPDDDHAGAAEARRLLCGGTPRSPGYDRGTDPPRGAVPHHRGTPPTAHPPGAGLSQAGPAPAPSAVRPPTVNTTTLER